MNIEYILARRTAQYDRGSRAAVMMRIAAVSVALGITVMIVTLAVIAGFRHEIYGTLCGFAGDIQVFDASGLGRSEPNPTTFSPSFVERMRGMDHVSAVWPYASVGGMVKSEDQVAGLRIKGVGEDYDMSWWRSRLTEGELPATGGAERRKDILISRSTAQSMRVGVGDKLEMLFVEQAETPRRDRFRVAGIYDTGMEELDRVTALTDIRNVQRLLQQDVAGDGDTSDDGADNELITGYELRVDDVSLSDTVAADIDADIDAAFYGGDDDTIASCLTATLEMRYPVVFDWLKAHAVNARVIVIIMMMVLLLNMVSALLIMVLDRTGMIGTLKASGMRNSSIRRIFLYRSAMLFVRGAVWGNIVGLGLVGIQALFGVVRLDPEGYMLSLLPVRVELWWWLLLNVVVMSVTVAAMIVPSLIVARIKPEESLKYKQ